MSYQMHTVCMQVRRGYSVLLESKMERWHAQRRALVEAIQDLAAFYQALQALPRSTSTADLSEWFEHLIEQVRPCLDLLLGEPRATMEAFVLAPVTLSRRFSMPLTIVAFKCQAFRLDCKRMCCVSHMVCGPFVKLPSLLEQEGCSHALFVW